MIRALTMPQVLGLAHVAGDDAETIMAQMHGVEQLLAQACP